MNSFETSVAEHAPAEWDSRAEGLRATGIETIQVNIGLTCNLECHHCHVASSPRRVEQMSRETAQAVIRAVEVSGATTVDITGGAPEMNPHFREFVAALSRLGVRILVRTNLTILLAEGFRDLPEFFRDHRVEPIASLPCYLMENVDAQRGEGVYRESIAALLRLNEIGYGIREDLPLRLVYNPVGAHLPPAQEELQAAYRKELWERHGVRFTSLYTMTNMPIGQFQGDLRRAGRLDSYRDLLKQAFNPETVEGLMCRRQISVDWLGRLYDCDFNLALRLPLRGELPANISDFSTEPLRFRRIATADHCFGCTAGAGSSCGGALAQAD